MYIYTESMNGLEIKKEFSEITKSQKKWFIELFAKAGFNEQQKKRIKKRMRQFFNGNLKKRFPNEISEVTLTESGCIKLKLERV